MTRRERLTLFLLLCSICLWSQRRPQPVEIPSYPCLHTDRGQDSLRFPGSHERFDSLYRRLDTLLVEGRGNVNILHIGGSHVQSGDFSHRMRTHFATFTSHPGNRGMLFPFTALKTNAPQNYAMWHEGAWSGARCVKPDAALPLGLSGACVETSDTLARIFLSMNSLSEWRTDTLRILGEGSQDTVVPMLLCGSDTLSPLPSDGYAGFRFALLPETDTCALFFPGLHDENVSFRLRGIMPEGRLSGITYTASGINGASVPSWLKCELFTDELSLVKPDLVVFGIGINDANVLPQRFNPEQFKSNYRRLIERIRMVNPACCFIFITNNDCWFNVRGRRRQFNTNTPRVQQAMTELAREYDGAVFDAFALMGGLRSSNAWVKAGLQRADHIHFTRQGYELWGDLLYNAVVNDFLLATQTPEEP